MSLKAQLKKLIRPAPPGTPTLADQFPGATADGIRQDVALARQGKSMSLSYRDISAEDEAPKKVVAA